MTARQINHKFGAADRVISVSYAEELDDGEILIGVPVVSEITTSDLTITNISISSTALTINKEVVSAGKAIRFSIAGGLNSTFLYEILITVLSNSSPAQTYVDSIKLQIVS